MSGLCLKRGRCCADCCECGERFCCCEGAFDYSTNVKCRIVIACVCFSVCIVMPCLLLYFLGYAPNSDFARHAVESACTVRSSTIVEKTCTYSCNCYTTCVTIGKSTICTPHCSVCSYQCFPLTVTFSYNVSNALYYKPVLVGTYESKQNALYSQSNNYKDGFVYKCFFDERDGWNLKFEVPSATGYYVAIWLVATFGALFLVAYCVAEQYRRTRWK